MKNKGTIHNPITKTAYKIKKGKIVHMKKETQQILSKITNATCELRKLVKLFKKNNFLTLLAILVALSALVISLIAFTRTLEVQGIGTDESLNQKFLEENSRESQLFILSDLISSPIKKEVDSNQSPELKLAYKIIECESNWRPNIVGDQNYPHPAYGLIQVQKRTWKWLSKKMDFEGDINNLNDQIDFLVLALENGYGHYWSCYYQVK